MLHRPKPGDTEEELLQQDSHLKREPTSNPRHGRPQSKFAASRSKKSKNDVVDYTVMQEALARSSVKSSVMGNIVERPVPPQGGGGSTPFMRPPPGGNPTPPRIPYWKFKPIPGKSIFKQYMESLGSTSSTVSMDEASVSTSVTSDDASITMKEGNRTASTAPRKDQGTRSALEHKNSSAICGSDSLGQMEAAAIHRENLSRISQMSPAEIEREREEIFSQCDPELLQYLKTMRSKKREVGKDSITSIKSAGDGNTEHDSMEVDSTDPGASKMEIDEPSQESISQFPEKTSVSSETVRPCEEDPSKVPNTETVDGLPDQVLSEDAASCTQTTNTGTADEEPIDENDLPIKPSEAKQWINMSKVEMDKLRWTTPMPTVPPLTHRGQSYVARFDLTGTLLPYDVSVDYREGLHHHGDEPGRAGYSLDELFVLARSSVLQQRHLALTTLAAILTRLWQGHYHRCFQSPLLQMMLDSGLVVLLRFSLDESVTIARVAGVNALAALLGSETIDPSLLCCGSGRPGIASSTHAQAQVRAELREEEAELKDAELLQLDVIRALIRVDTLVRIRYIVEHLESPPECTLHLLSILSRVASHSLTSAWKVISVPRLLQCLLQRYLPHDVNRLLTGENVEQMTSVEGVPLRHTLLLVKILCSWGRHLASELLTKHDLMSRLLAFVSIDPTEIALPLPEVLKLSVEAYNVWGILLGYGLQTAQKSFLEFYPYLMRQMLFYRDKVAINEDTGSNQLNFDMGANMAHMFSRALSVAATKRLLDSQVKSNSGIRGGLDDKVGDTLQPPLIGWASMMPAAELIFVCCKKWLVQLQRNDTTFSGLKLLGSTCGFVENYFRKWKDQYNYSASDYISQMEKFYNECLAPFLQSEALTKLVSKIECHSALCSGLESSSVEDAKNLASLNTITLGGKVTPLLLPTSPFPLLLPLFSLLDTLHQLHPGLPTAPTHALVNHEAVLGYLQTLTSKELSLRSQWFTRLEASLLAHLLHIASVKKSAHPLLYHSAAIVTLPCLQKGQEHLAKLLVTDVLCTEDSVGDLSEMSTQIDSISLNDYEPLKSPALFKTGMTPLQLTTKMVNDIVVIGGQLSSSLFENKALKESAVLIKDIPFLINTISIEHTETLNLLDNYWTLLPLRAVMLENIIKMAIANEDAKSDPKKAAESLVMSSDQSDPETLVRISRCIQMTYLNLRFRNKVALQSTNVTGWLRYLSLTFLVANDLFLDHNIHSYLQGCFRELLRDEGFKRFNDKLEFTGLGNSFDWYKKLIEQYVAVSYGDFIFAVMLLLPAQQMLPIAFRSLLWGDLSDALPLIRIKTSEVETFIPVNQFLDPPEEDEEMLYKYHTNLATGVITEARTPFLWTVARHHLSSAITRRQNSSS